MLPVPVLIALLDASVYLYGDSSSSGPNQLALILSGMAGALLGWRNGFSWKELQAGIVHGISLATGAILILLMVGSLIGTWILAGIVPTMIHFGLSVLSPDWFYAAAVVICAVVALATGSSWTTAGTIGVAVVGIATVQNLNLGLAAGAIVSGAYFGDKMSPLSDTTNLAPATAGTDLFTHIRHMVWTTTPSILIAIALYAGIGFYLGGASDAPEIAAIQTQLEQRFNIGWVMQLPAVVVIASPFDSTAMSSSLRAGSTQSAAGRHGQDRRSGASDPFRSCSRSGAVRRVRPAPRPSAQEPSAWSSARGRPARGAGAKVRGARGGARSPKIMDETA